MTRIHPFLIVTAVRRSCKYCCVLWCQRRGMADKLQGRAGHSTTAGYCTTALFSVYCSVQCTLHSGNGLRRDDSSKAQLFSHSPGHWGQSTVLWLHLTPTAPRTCNIYTKFEPFIHSVVESECISDSVVMFARQSGYIKI